jgi:hypothetical protein
MTFLTTYYKKDGYQSLLGLLKTFEALQTIQFQWSLFLDFMNKNNNKINTRKFRRIQNWVIPIGSMPNIN